VLVVANQPLAGSDLRERILERYDGHVLVDILAPVLTSRIHYAMSESTGSSLTPATVSSACNANSRCPSRTLWSATTVRTSRPPRPAE
jgi:hypothetical protein